MKIIVRPEGFEWNGQPTRRLWGPACAAGLAWVTRQGLMFDTCEIREIGVPLGAGSFGMLNGGALFYGLQKVFGTPYNRNIVAGRFALGDQIDISLPGDITAAEYWGQMQDT